MGLFNHRARISLAREWEGGTRFHDWLAITPPPRQQAQGCLLTWRIRPRTHHPPGSLPPRRALPDVAHAHVMGTPMGLFNHRAPISITREWEETRCRGWLAITPPPRQQAQGCLLTWRIRPRTYHIRYHHAEFCPPWRMRT